MSNKSTNQVNEKKAVCPSCGRPGVQDTITSSYPFCDTVSSLQECICHLHVSCPSCGWYQDDSVTYIDDDYNDVHCIPKIVFNIDECRFDVK